MQTPPLSPHPDPEALVALARLWLLRVAAVLIELVEGRIGGALKRALRLHIAHAERGVEAIIFLMASARITWPPSLRRETHRPRNTPRGFRRSRVGSDVRRLTHGAFAGARTGALSERVRRMLDVLAHPERSIARMIRRIVHGLVRARLVAAAPPTRVFICGAPAPRPAGADSS
jgi:hypothetical protein